MQSRPNLEAFAILCAAPTNSSSFLGCLFVVGQCKIARIVRIRNFTTVCILRFYITPALLVLLTAVCFPSPLDAQSEATAEDARVQKLYGDAKAAEARGDLPAAAANYESLLQIAPRLAPAYNNLGSLYLRQREYKKAADVLEKGLKIDPKMSSASALLGIALYELGEYAGASRNLESALRANPKDNNAELFLANDLIKLGEFQRAAEHLRQLSQRQQENPEVLYLLGKVHMKLSEQALSKTKRAGSEFRVGP